MRPIIECVLCAGFVCAVAWVSWAQGYTAGGNAAYMRAYEKGYARAESLRPDVTRQTGKR